MTQLRSLWLVILCAAAAPQALAQDEDETLPESETESETESGTESETETETETETESEAESVPETEPESATDERDLGPEPLTTSFDVTVPARADNSRRLILPPFYFERDGDTRTVALFPLYFRRSAPDENMLVAGLYYNREKRSPRADGLTLDRSLALFPLFFRVSRSGSADDDFTTWVIPPAYYHRDQEGYAVGAAPLFFHGARGEKSHTVIPPLLTFSVANEDRATTLATLFWRVRREERVRWGLFPILWGGHGEGRSHIVLPPFVRLTDDEEGEALTVVGPAYHKKRSDGASWGLAPALFHSHGADSTAWTVPPLAFHYSRDGADTRLVTPLFGYFDVNDRSTLITPVYQRYRGDTELDSVFPLFFSLRDPRDGDRALVVPPLVWHFDGPMGNSTVVAPFFGRWHDRGHYTAWATPLVASWRRHDRDAGGLWIAPTLQISHANERQTLNLHPIFYHTHGARKRHTVALPVLFFDFLNEEKSKRSTVQFPLYWRFRRGSTVSQLVLNSFHRTRVERGVQDWEFHFFPLVAFGKQSPDDHWWKVLYGLAGYTRQGSYARMHLLWVPITVDRPNAQAESTNRFGRW